MSNDQGDAQPASPLGPMQQPSTSPAASIHHNQLPVTDGVVPPFSPPSQMLPPPNYGFPRYVSGDNQRAFTAAGQTLCGHPCHFETSSFGKGKSIRIPRF